MSSFFIAKIYTPQVVNSVVTHFQLNPPTNLRIIDKSLQKMQPGNRASTATGRRSQKSNGAEQQSVNGNGQPHSPQRKKDASEMHFSEVVSMAPSDEQHIRAMMDGFVSTRT